MNSSTALAIQTTAAVDSTSSLLSLGLDTLVIVIALGIVALLVARRFGRTRAAGPRGAVIEAVDTRVLGPKRSIHLLRVGANYVLVGASEAGLQPLAGAELDARALDALTRAPQPTVERSPNASFLQRLMQGSPRRDLPAPH
ncbi:MAG: flagellar biosynthetic protein FliO [Planctomycetes bacterium]|nr:flagellar biosynthetic protein FliO [Planctomycetota bacterium]